MDSETAKALVKAHVEDQKVNFSWIGSKLGRSRQQIRQWLTGENEPIHPSVWIEIAEVLGFSNSRTEIEAAIHNLALEVLERCEDPSLRAKAADVLRKLRNI